MLKCAAFNRIQQFNPGLFSETFEVIRILRQKLELCEPIQVVRGFFLTLLTPLSSQSLNSVKAMYLGQIKSKLL